MSNTAATIQGQTFHYEGPLTIEKVRDFRDTIGANLPDCEYLFVTKKGKASLTKTSEFQQKIIETMGMSDRKFAFPRMEPHTTEEMHVVVLPTLPENTLIIGKFVLSEDPIQALSDQCENTMQDYYKGLD